MDKKTLNALNNFALALEELVSTFEKKAKEEEEFGGLGGVFSQQQDMNNTLLRIEEGIENIENSNKKMVSNQDKILGMTKDIKSSQDSNNLFAFGKGDKNKKGIKEGVGSIILIAAGVLAIGYAFKMVGGVDFISVIALSVAIPLIASAFVLTAVAISEWGLTTKDILMASVSLSIMSLSLTMSSWILQYIQPIGAYQLLTAIGIAAAFVVISLSIESLANAVGNINAKDLIMLPTILITMSISLAVSSQILQYIQPVGLSQLLTAIGIGAVFVIISYSISKIVKASSNIDAKDLIMLPLVLVTMSTAIALSSFILGYTQPIPLNLLLNIALQSVVLGIIGIALSIPLLILSKSGLGIKDAFMGGAMIVIIAGAMMLSSLILNYGTYDNFPSAKWALGVGTAIILFSLPMVALGFIAMTGIGFAALLLGGVSTLIVAGTIAATSHIIAEGDYNTSGDFLKWATGVSLLYSTFTPIMIALGALKGLTALLSFGMAADPMESAKIMMVKIAETIRDVSFVLSEGNYDSGPTSDWAGGVGLAISAFAPVFQTLSAMNVWSLFGDSKFSADDYASAIVTISMSIIEAADVFRTGPSRWEGGPTKAWAEGVGSAIGAFAPIFEILNSQGIMDSIFGTTVTPEDMNRAIIMIANSIMGAANIFNNDNGSYKGGPTKKWAEGVGSAITSFSQIYEWVFDGVNWTPSHIDQANGVIYKIARSILHMSKIFQGYEIGYDAKTGEITETKGKAPKWGSFPSKKWSTGVTDAIIGFTGLYEWVFDGSNWSESDIIEANQVIFRIADSIKEVANIMEPLGNIKIPSANAAGDLAKNLESWEKIVQGADDLDSGGLSTTATRIQSLADGVDKLATALLTLNGALKSLQTNNLDALNNIAGTFISFSVIDEDNFSAVMDIVSDSSDSLAELFGTAKDNLDQSGSESNWWDSFIGAGNNSTEIKAPVLTEETEKKKTLDDLYTMLQSMNDNLGTIASNSDNLSSYVNELRSNPEVKIK